MIGNYKGQDISYWNELIYKNKAIENKWYLLVVLILSYHTLLETIRQFLSYIKRESFMNERVNSPWPQVLLIISENFTLDCEWGKAKQKFKFNSETIFKLYDRVFQNIPASWCSWDNTFSSKLSTGLPQ